METIILKVVEGRGKTGQAKNGKKRFLFTENSIEKFNNVVFDFAKKYKQKYPHGGQDYKSLREQFLKLVLKYDDAEIKDFEIKELNKTLRVANLTKLVRIPYLNIDKMLNAETLEF